ncbi:MAG: shikimate kinase, partial [Promethearchaeota archaeon]
KEQRPLLNVEDPIKEIRRLLAFRKPFYEAASDLKIITYKKFPEQIADEIINLIKYLEEGDVKYLKNPSDLNNVFNDISNVLFKEGIPLGGKNGDKNKEGAEGTGQGANSQSDKENKVTTSADKKKSLKVNKHVIDISKADAQNKLFSENFPITKIMKLCSLNKSIRPLDLVNEAFRDEDLIKDPYHLYALIPAAILYALRNKIKKDGPLIIRKELLINKKEDHGAPNYPLSNTKTKEKVVKLTEIRDENIAIAIMRAFKIQYGAGVYMGIAEPAIATGISFSVMLGATQKYARFVEFSNRATLFALQTLIEHHLFGEKNTIKSVEIILKRIPDFFKDFFENY